MAQIETYIPLYRKYRPQTFADLVGQTAIAQTLTNAITLNKVAHAYLFCGPRGTGKTSTARIFAKSLNCEQGPTPTPCGVCASCVGVVQGNALDIVEFDAASNNGVEDARELIENCQYGSMSGRYKIYIIDEVHMLSTSAFNALLKTLEEPPPNVVFIFATTEAHKVLATIISRCQRFDFQRITVSDIIERLRHIAQAESIVVEDDALQMIARHARGGMRDAVGLLDQVAVVSRAQPGHVLNRQDVMRFIGALEEEILFSIGNAIAQQQGTVLLESVTSLISRGVEPRQLVKELTRHFRNLYLVKVSQGQLDPNALNIPPELMGRLTEQAALFEENLYPQFLSKLADIEQNVRRTQQPQLWLEVGLLEIAHREGIYQIHELAERVRALEGQLAGGAPIARPAAATPKPAVATPPQARPQPMPQPTLQQPESASVQQPHPPQPQPTVTPASGALNWQQTQPVQQTTSEPQLTTTPASGAHTWQPQTTYVMPQPQQAAAVPGAPNWQEVCALIASTNAKTLAMQHTSILEFKDDYIKVGCSSEPTLELLKKPEKLLHLQKAADKYFGKPMRLEFLLSKNKPAETPQAAAQVAPQATTPPLPQAVTHASQPVAAPQPVPEPEPQPQAAPLTEAAPVIPPVIPEQPALVGTSVGNSSGSDMDLEEAKQYSVQLLQGKVVQ